MKEVNSSTVTAYVRSNILGLVALFIALSGTTWAAAQIGADDLKKDAVRSKHIRDGQVRGEDVDAAEVQLRVGGSCPSGEAIRAVNLDGTVACELDDASVGGGPAGPAGPPGPTGPQGPPGTINGVPAGGDLSGMFPSPQIAAGAVGGNELASNAVGSAKVTDGSLTGDDIEESKLTGAEIDGVDAASVGGIPAAEIGAVGRSASGGLCMDPEGDGQNCVTLALTVPRPARVLVTAAVNWGVGGFSSDTLGNQAYGRCSVTRSPGGDVASTTLHGEQQVSPGADAWSQPGNGTDFLATATALGVTGPLAPGEYTLALRCTRHEGNIAWNFARLTALIIGSA